MPFIAGLPWLKIGGLAIAALVVLFGYLYVVGLTDTIKAQAADIATLQIAEKVLTAEVASMTTSAAVVRAEVKFTQERDKEKDILIGKLRQDITSQERSDKLERGMRGRPSLLLRVVNKSANCEWTNFYNYDGVCKAGVWKPFSK